MSKNRDSDEIEKLIESLPEQSQVEAYRNEELIACASCSRKNPPNRLECLYCGVELELSEEQSQMIKPVLRKLDAWKNGINLIHIADGKIWDEKQIATASQMTRLESNILSEIASSGKSLPLARTESRSELEVAQRRFQEIGIESIIFEDKTFELQSTAARLRKIEFAGSKLKLTSFNVNEVIEIDQNDLQLVVIGAIFKKKIESTENYKKKGDNKVLESREITADEMLIDLYIEKNQIPYRIESNGFDFSFLGDEKAFVVGENMKILLEKLKNFANKASYDEDYLRVRGVLSQVWEVEEKTDLKGIHRKGFGRFNKEQTFTSDNLEQFNKYSRLQWHLLNR